MKGDRKQRLDNILLGVLVIAFARNLLIYWESGREDPFLRVVLVIGFAVYASLQIYENYFLNQKEELKSEKNTCKEEEEKPFAQELEPEGQQESLPSEIVSLEDKEETESGSQQKDKTVLTLEAEQRPEYLGQADHGEGKQENIGIRNPEPLNVRQHISADILHEIYSIDSGESPEGRRQKLREFAFNKLNFSSAAKMNGEFAETDKDFLQVVEEADYAFALYGDNYLVPNFQLYLSWEGKPRKDIEDEFHNLLFSRIFDNFPKDVKETSCLAGLKPAMVSKEGEAKYILIGKGTLYFK